MELVLGVRKRQPRSGGKKVYKKIRRELQGGGIKVGRDKFYEILGRKGLLIERRKRVYTTESGHRFKKYPNLVKEMRVERPDQVYVSDITYIKTLEGYSYLSLVTDGYSRRIVGYCLSTSLAIEGCIEAMKMALKGRQEGELTHHSDRGIQYCSKEYVELLRKSGVRISMTEENHVYENSLAERVNGILKDEFMLGETLQSFKRAKRMVVEAVKIYNEERYHMSLKMKTPDEVHFNLN